MSFNTFGKLFRFSTWGESHGPAIGCIVDGCPPNISIKEQDIQVELDKRKPGQSKFTTQRKEDDKVQILSGVCERKTINKFVKNTTISVKGRHDPCVGIRAVPVGEAMMNCVLLDHYLMHKAQCS